MARPLPVGILLIAAAGPAWGAAAPRDGGTPACAPLRYLVGRVGDLMDVFELSVGRGRGAKLDLKYGVQFFGLGRVRSWRLGMIDRRVGRWREIDEQLGLLPLSLLAWPVHYVARLCGARALAADAHFVAQAGSEGVEHLDRKELNGDPEFFVKDTVEGPNHTRWGDCFPIGGEIHAGVGVRAMVRPLQLVDFVVGFVGVDLDPWLTKERR